MTRASAFTFLILIPFAPLSSAERPEAAPQRTLTFAQRVAAEEAIGRVYYRHQIDATKSFEEAVPRQVLENRVTKHLKQSEALEVYWNTPVTGEMLARELDRMVRGTRRPDRLHEIFAALDNDTFLIEECLARATLVDRLARDLYAFDPILHLDARQRAQGIQRQLANGTLDPWSDHPERSVVDLVERDPEAVEIDPRDADGGTSVGNRLARRLLSPGEFQAERAKLPGGPGQVGPVMERRDDFVIRVVLAQGPREVRVASYVVPKKDWDLWWESVKNDLPDERVVPVASSASSEALRRGTGTQGGLDALRDEGAGAAWANAVPCAVANTWTPTMTTGAPIPRTDHSAVWTGSFMIVWGGSFFDVSTQALSSGGRYDPATDTWTPTSSLGTPSSRFGHTAVWTGSGMVVWGGAGGSGVLRTGGRYDPGTDTWAATSTTGAPAARYLHAAVWTGSEMVVWGGDGNTTSLATGGRYDPATDNWTATSSTGAPSARFNHSAVWSGTAMLVWGGYSGDDLDTGGQYDPQTDTWTATSTVEAPSGRSVHTAIWTGSVMVVWGGLGVGGNLDSGGRYDPQADAWTATSTAGAPPGRYRHTAVWTGSEMVVWGGQGLEDALDSGGRYDPAADTWTATATTGAPSRRYDHTAVWTESEMIVWGGAFYDGLLRYLGTGGRYAPATWGCNDGNPCTTDICEGATGCAHVPTPGVTCSDGSACTTGDTCSVRGLCVGGAPLECADQNPCTTDACDPATGCAYAPVPCWSVDFAPATSQVPPGFVKDDGSVFSPARGFGWDASVSTRARNSANPLELDTFAFSQVPRTWTAEVANGNYEVCLKAGDPSVAQGPHRVRANGITLIDDVTTPANVFAASCPAGAPIRSIPVRNGRLAVEIGGAAGNTMINYLVMGPVSGSSPLLWSIDFQPAAASPAPGFLADSGQPFDVARGYGWDAAVDSRERNRPVPQVLDTFVFSFAVRTWELALPNGDCDVWYGLGDPDFTQGPHRLVVEGTTVVEGTATQAGAFIEGKTAARVTDGKLTVAIGQGGARAQC